MNTPGLASTSQLARTISSMTGEPHSSRQRHMYPMPTVARQRAERHGSRDLPSRLRPCRRPDS